MMRKVISILIVILCASSLLVMTGLVKGHPITQYGYPAFVTIEYVDAIEAVKWHTFVKFNVFNILCVFGALGVSIFYAGFLWASVGKAKSIEIDSGAESESNKEKSS